MKSKIVMMIVFLSVVGFQLQAISKKHFNFVAEPIDLVIPTIAKDREALALCIDGIKTAWSKHENM